MDLGKVIGTVVATRKDPSLEGTRLLIVQPLDEKHNPIAEPLVAVDTLHDAGVGETVYIVTGGDAVSVIPGKRMPVDVAIVGIVDSISLFSELQTPPTEAPNTAPEIPPDDMES